MQMWAKIYDLNFNELYSFTQSQIIDLQFTARLNYFDSLQPREISVIVQANESLVNDIKNYEFSNTYTKWIDNKIIQTDFGYFIGIEAKLDAEKRTVRIKARDFLELFKKITIPESVIRNFYLDDFLKLIAQKFEETYTFVNCNYMLPDVLVNNADFYVTYSKISEMSAFDLLKRIQKIFGGFIDTWFDGSNVILRFWGGVDALSEMNYTIYDSAGNTVSTQIYDSSTHTFQPYEITNYVLQNPRYRFKSFRVKGKTPNISDVYTVYKGATPDQTFNVPDGGYPVGDDEFWVETEKDLYELRPYSEIICEPSNIIDQTVYESNFADLANLIPKYPRRFRLQFNNSTGSTINLTNIEVKGKTVDFDEEESIYEVESASVYSLKNQELSVEDDLLQTSNLIQKLAQYYGSNLGNRPVIEVKLATYHIETFETMTKNIYTFSGVDSLIDDVKFFPLEMQFDARNFSFILRLIWKFTEPTYNVLPKKEVTKTITPSITPEGIKVPKTVKQQVGEVNDSEQYFYWDGENLVIKGGIKISGSEDISLIDSGIKIKDGDYNSSYYNTRTLYFDNPYTQLQFRFQYFTGFPSWNFKAGIIAFSNILNGGISIVHRTDTTTGSDYYYANFGFNLGSGMTPPSPGIKVTSNVDEKTVEVRANYLIIPHYYTDDSISGPYYFGSIFVWGTDLCFVDENGNIRVINPDM